MKFYPLIKFLCLSFLFIPSQGLHAESEYWQQRTSLFEILPISNNDIVFLGNSITDGGEFTELFDNPHIKNRGISSDIIGGVKKRLDQVTSGHPKQIFLLIGINDISHGHSVAELASRYEALVEEIRHKTPHTQLLLQSIMPVNNDFKRYRNLIGKEKTIVELNKEIEHIAQKHGAIYIDLWPALADPTSKKLIAKFTNDGLHLTGEGYKAWTTYIKPYLSTEP